MAPTDSFFYLAKCELCDISSFHFPWVQARSRGEDTTEVLKMIDMEACAITFFFISLPSFDKNISFSISSEGWREEMGVCPGIFT